MPRADLQKADAATDYWYLQPKFKTKEDAQAAADLLQGLAECTVIVYEKKVTAYELTIVGRTILEVFEVPNRSYHIEDIQAHLQERHYAASTAASYLPQLVRAGYLKKLGPQTYIRKHDPASPVCTDLGMATASDGQPARLVAGEADRDRRGDAR